MTRAPSQDGDCGAVVGASERRGSALFHPRTQSPIPDPNLSPTPTPTTQDGDRGAVVGASERRGAAVLRTRGLPLFFFFIALEPRVE